MAYQSFLSQQHRESRFREYVLFAEQQVDYLHQLINFLPINQIDFENWNNVNALDLPQGHGDLLQDNNEQVLIVHWGKTLDHTCRAKRSGLSGCRRLVLASLN